MSELSILEFVVYAVIGYAPMGFLMAYILVDKPAKSSDSIMRIVYVMPGMVGVLMLASVGGFSVITNSDYITSETISDYEVLNTLDGVVTLNSTTTETKATSSYFTLQNPMWVMFNGMLFILYVLYVIINVVQLIGVKEED